MCNLVSVFEKYLGESCKEQTEILKLAGKCSGLRMLIYLAYRDDAAEILREIRKELEKRLR